MEERRLQRSGASTLTVSLPADWVDAVGLDKGDGVLVTPTEDGGLTLYPSKGRARDVRTARVMARRLPRPEAAADVLQGLYAAGWERVRVTSPEALPTGLGTHVRTAAARLPGLEVLSETRDGLDVAASLDPDAFPLRALLRRLEMTASTALKDAFEAFDTRNPGLADAAHVRAQDGARLLALARRQATLAVARPGLTRALAGTLRDALVLRSAAEVLAGMAQDADGIAEAVLDVIGFDVPVPEESRAALAEARDALVTARDAATGALLGDDVARALEARASAPHARNRALAAIRAVREGGHPSVARRLARMGAHLETHAARVDDLALLALERLALADSPVWGVGD